MEWPQIPNKTALHWPTHNKIYKTIEKVHRICEKPNQTKMFRMKNFHHSFNNIKEQQEFDMESAVCCSWQWKPKPKRKSRTNYYLFKYSVQFEMCTVD